MYVKLNYSNYQDAYNNIVEDYGEWYCHNDYTYDSAKLVKQSSHVGIFPNEITENVTHVYVVIAVMSEGDSFGNETGVHEWLWAFTNEENANRLAKAIEDDYKEKPDYDFDHSPFEYEGVNINTNRWKGYFENLTSVNVEKLKLE